MTIVANTYDMKTIPSAGKDWHESLQTEDASGCGAIKPAESGFSHYLTKLKIRTDAGMDISIGSGGDDGDAVTTVHFGPIPMPGLGTELIVNGGFDIFDDWVLGDDWTEGVGDVEYAGNFGAEDPSLSQEIVDIVSGKTYQVQLDARGSLVVDEDDDIVISLGGGTGLALTSFDEDSGTFTAELTAGGNGFFKINDDSPAFMTTLFVDNVSVREIAGGGAFDWKAPRGMGIKCTPGLSLALDTANGDASGAGTLWIEAHGKSCKD